MEVKECYEAFGGSYESVKQRIPTDTIIKKFMLKFLEEPTFLNLSRALESGEYEEAFRAAHSLKGVSVNLGFNNLGNSAGTLTELLRKSGEKSIHKEDWEEIFARVSEDYNTLVECISKLD